MIVESEVTDAPMAQIVVDNAKAAFAQVLELFHPPVVVLEKCIALLLLAKM